MCCSRGLLHAGNLLYTWLRGQLESYDGHAHAPCGQTRVQLADRLYVPLGKLLTMHPELRPFVEDGSVVYFEACLAQMRQGDLQLLVEGPLGIPWSKLNSFHISLACTTWSWAYLSKNQYHTLEGAALDNEAQVMEKLHAGSVTLKVANQGLASSQLQGPDHV